VGSRDEGIEAGQAEEDADGTDAAGALLLEDGEGGQDEAAQAALAGRAAEEGADLGLDAVRDRRAQPVAEGGARDGVLVGVAALRRRRMKGVAEVSVSLGTVLAWRAGGVLAGGGLGSSVRGSHGSCPCGVGPGKPTVGKRAWLV